MMAKILIVEDDADLVETYTDLLEMRGHSVHWASRITEANDFLVEVQPEIITLDLNLPGTSGAATLNFVQTAKALSQCKIIVISGHTEMMSGQDWMADVDLILTKPVDNYQFVTMVDRLLST
ncbi:MAG: response regulator [Chloroflexota bacterium]